MWGDRSSGVPLAEDSRVSIGSKLGFSWCQYTASRLSRGKLGLFFYFSEVLLLSDSTWDRDDGEGKWETSIHFLCDSWTLHLSQSTPARGLKFPEMGHLPEDEGESERREKREWTDDRGGRLSFNSYLNRRRTFILCAGNCRPRYPPHPPTAL